MDLELRHLRCLVAIVDSGTFTDASIELGISQAAVSRNLMNHGPSRPDQLRLPRMQRVLAFDHEQPGDPAGADRAGQHHLGFEGEAGLAEERVDEGVQASCQAS